MSAPETAKPRRSIAVAVGWALTVPGLVMAASYALALGLNDLAGCRINMQTATYGCAPGVLGNVAEILIVIAILSAMSVVHLYGLVPIVYSVAFPIVRLWRRLRRARG